MLRKKPEISWEFSPEEEQGKPWLAAPEELSAVEKGRHLRRSLLFTLVMVVFLTAGVGAAYAYQEASQGVEIIKQEMEAVVDTEQWMQRNAPDLAAEVAVGDASSLTMKRIIAQEQAALDAHMDEDRPAPTVRIEETWFAGDVVAAEVTFTQSAGEGDAPRVYKQTRFYRDTPRGWLRTAPDPALWGAPLARETDHLIWDYRQQDDAVVTEIAGKMDAVYVALSRDYGLTLPAAGDKQVIHVQVDAAPVLIALNDAAAGPISVASPSIYLAPAERSEAEILAQAVGLALVKTMWARAVAQHGIKESWPSMAAVSLWEIWAMEMSLAEWREEVMQWVYGEIVGAANDAEVELPARYDEFCAAHAIWMTTPIVIGIPLNCNSDGDQSAKHNSTLLHGLREDTPTRLEGVTLHYTAQNPYFVRLGNILMVYTVVDYAVTTYGRERLPELVAALGQHDDWRTLIPDVYGVPFEEFERGWREHVAGLARE